VCDVWRYCAPRIPHPLQSRVTGFPVEHATASSCAGVNAEYEDLRHFSRTSAVIKDRDTKHPVDSEQGGMCVHRSRVESLHVVERNRRVDEKAKKSGAD
jgi:hypothetical protein